MSGEKDTGYWLLVAGGWLLDTKMPDAGYQMQNTECRMQMGSC